LSNPSGTDQCSKGILAGVLGSESNPSSGSGPPSVAGDHSPRKRRKKVSFQDDSSADPGTDPVIPDTSDASEWGVALPTKPPRSSRQPGNFATEVVPDTSEASEGGRALTQPLRESSVILGDPHPPVDAAPKPAAVGAGRRRPGGSGGEGGCGVVHGAQFKPPGGRAAGSHPAADGGAVSSGTASIGPVHPGFSRGFANGGSGKAAPAYAGATQLVNGGRKFGSAVGGELGRFEESAAERGDGSTAATMGHEPAGKNLGGKAAGDGRQAENPNSGRKWGKRVSDPGPILLPAEKKRGRPRSRSTLASRYSQELLTPHHTTPHHTTPHQTTPHHTTPHHTTPHHTTPHHTLADAHGVR
jgi:hypothetical protein